MKAIDLNRLDLFTLPNADHKRTNSHTIYQMVEQTDDGIIIEKLAESTFRCSWNAPDSILKLNFDVLIEHFKLTGTFCLIHWQAKPKGLRRWGVYCSAQDSYFSTDYDLLIFDEGLKIEALQIDEKIIKTVPTAVLCLRDAIVELSDEKILVRRL